MHDPKSFGTMNELLEMTKSKSCEENSDSEEPPSNSGCEITSEPLIPLFDSYEILKDKYSQKSATSAKTNIFRKSHYPHVSREEWNDWRWQLQNRITSVEELSLILRLSDKEKEAMEKGRDIFPFSVTPYYASLLDRDDPSHPLRRTVIPVMDECIKSEGEADDPLHEEGDSPAPCIVHRYPDRVLFLVTDFCSTYCRYCTRSRMVGRSACAMINKKNWEMAISYIESHSEIRDVLLSGGDPLTLSDEALKWLLTCIRRIPHVEIIRIGSKVPVVLPQRITKSLVTVLRHFHPLWMNIHFTHADEITPETEIACKKLSNAGIPLGSQTVLLKGVNDSVDTLKKLYHKLLMCRVRPYYLYQCDPITGSSHFRTTVEKGVNIIKGLRGFTTGFAVPNYVIDAPGGGGKIPIQPEYYIGRDDDGIHLMNYEDKHFVYPEKTVER